MEWLLERAAIEVAQTSWLPTGYRRGHGGTRAHSPVGHGAELGITVVPIYGPAPLARSQFGGAHQSVGALQAEGGSGAPEAGEGAGGAPFRGGSEDGCRSTTSRGVRSGERGVRAASRRSLICVRRLWMSV